MASTRCGSSTARIIDSEAATVDTHTGSPAKIGG